MGALTTILGWFTGSGLIGQLSEPILRMQEMRLQAENDAQRLEYDRAIAAMESSRDIALMELQDKWSATRIGRNLIVIPYGVWWASIYAVQIINPWITEPLFGLTLVIRDVPPHINEMATYLIPAIVIGDVGQFATKTLGRARIK